MPTLTPSERIGTTIGGRYEVRRLLGEGGFSVVFEAVHTITGREVALKILHPHLTQSEQIAERFLMEARAMARIKHDGIVQVLDAGTDPDGAVFIALELLDGESLEATLLRVHKLTWGEAVGICVAILDALAEAHRHKIIHRDIKPGNIFIVRKPDGSSQYKLLDFGIAHVTQAKNKLTAAGMILGTPEYMSPEQGRTANVGPESDLWAVGIVMWECITGHTPFVAETATEILLKIATTDTPTILDEVPDLPPPVAAVIDKSLTREVTQRYRSSDEMRDAMVRAQRKVDEAAAPASTRASMRGNLAPPRFSSSPGVAAGANNERRVAGPPDVVNVDVLTKFPVGSASAPRMPARVVSGDAGARAFGSSPSIPIGERPSPRHGAPEPRVSPASMSPPSPTTRAAAAVSEPRGAASSPLRATGVMPVGAADELPEERARPVVEERARPAAVDARTTSPQPPYEPPRTSPEAPRTQRAVEGLDYEHTPPQGRSLSPLPPPPLDVGARPSSPRIDPPEASAARSQGLTFDERESRTFSGQKNKFQKPPEARRVSAGLMAAAGASVALIGAGAWLALRTDATPDAPDARAPQRTDAHVAAPPPDAPPAEPPPPGADTAAVFTLVATNDVAMPQGITGADNAAEFARHAAASYHAGSTQRMLATCIAGADGSTLYLHPMTPGALRGSSKGIVACAGYDLGVVPDITADGSDDVVAVGARRNLLHFIDSRTLRPHRTMEVEGVRGIATGAQVMVRGEPAVVVFAEPHGPSAPTEVLAITALSGRVLWRIRLSGRMSRVGHPVELGLAVGPDADGDGVGDVVAGIGPVVDSSADGNPGDQRCVHLFSGADGHALWAQPFCRARSLGAQSVSLGPDVNADSKADVVVGTDQPGPGEAPVVVLSGADGVVLRQFAAPPGGAALGFGWPVALSGDLNNNGTPEILIGTVGSRTSVRVFDGVTGVAVTTLELQGLGAGNLRVFPIPTLVPDSPWSVAVASPGDGIHVYVRRNEQEPL
jgi:serine/threonine-protein kinase